MWSACHKEKVFVMCRIDEFWNIHETFPHFFSKQAKLRQPHMAETADFRFQISNFKIRQIAFLMTCRPHKCQTRNLIYMTYNYVCICKKSRLKCQEQCFFFVVRFHEKLLLILMQKIKNGLT